MITQVIENREISRMLRESGNFDYVLKLSQHVAYVKIGVDRVWITFSGDDKIFIVRTSLAPNLHSKIYTLVKKVFEEFKNRGVDILEISYLAV